ncbi:C4-dicarboxylate ABC transporter [Rhizobiaceae bacterium BDR2-2]|uniref:C4-dicarboxylate ABC transporter n=1 Tax=Ectorhizobium quercum TaxID=2965071 RepID=A0AAE3N149_9HYPH|nr:C4-dicarboxylate ABC transporter [Ectorhizobium quercum]MCX8998246.1 C4-dicarboxylate ABC transporter [Ectorhizobium quercum]
MLLLRADTAPPANGASDIVLHFTPNWFAASMGTGILAAALGQFPGTPVVHAAGLVLHLVNIALFLLFSVLYGLKWLCHTRLAARIFEHPVQSMFLGTIPMALATIVNGTLIFGSSLVGEEIAAAVATRLWLVDAVLAVAIGSGVPFLMFTRQSHAMADMSAVWLLPVVAAEVAAASGLLLLPFAGDGPAGLGILAASLALWAFSVPLALSVLVILFLRMALHKLPPAAMAATSWLALGPIGTGALGLALLALNGAPVLAANGLEAIAPAVTGAATLGALMLWGYGLWWLAIALLVTLRQIGQGLPFNLGWWAYTFPLGVYALATLKIGALLPLAFFTVAGTVMVGLLAVIWLLVTARTFAGAIRGRLFSDPCITSG